MNQKISIALAILAMTAAAGCDDTDPAWQLDNDRIIAVRATPSGLAAGEQGRLDLLVTSRGRGPEVIAPQLAIALPQDATAQEPPDELRAAVQPEGEAWILTAPDGATLASLRSSMGLGADAPVPLRVGVRVDLGSGPLDAVKMVTFGAARPNPELGAVSIGGVPAVDGLVIEPDVDVRMEVAAGPEDEVFWLTSIGELSDQDDPVATLVHKRSGDDLTEGHISVVVRDGQGGVSWGFWAVSVAP